jgi:hypothetical protein
MCTECLNRVAGPTAHTLCVRGMIP